MRTLTSLACTTTLTCVAVVTLLAACAAPSGGYYDERGNYIPYPPADRAVVAPSATVVPAQPGYTTTGPTGYSTTTTTYTYDRPGYYDYNGFYIATNSGLSVPKDMFPPRGMCRVWFPDRALENQPSVESCNGIQARVPAGAYVIYGG